MDFIDSKLVYKTNNLIKKVKLDFMCFYMFINLLTPSPAELLRIIIVKECLLFIKSK